MKYWAPTKPTVGGPCVPEVFRKFLENEGFEYTPDLEGGDADLAILAGYGGIPQYFYLLPENFQKASTYANHEVWTTLYAGLFQLEWYTVPTIGFGAGAALINAKMGKSLSVSKNTQETYDVLLVGEGKTQSRWVTGYDNVMDMDLLATPNERHKSLQGEWTDRQQTFPVAWRGNEEVPLVYEAVVYVQNFKGGSVETQDVYGAMREIPSDTRPRESTLDIFNNLVNKVFERTNT